MKIAIGLAVACLLLFVFREQWLMAIGNFLIVEDDLHPANVIHVIAGENYRIDYAIQLYHQGYGKKIFLTGGGWCPTHHVVHEGEWRQRSLDQGVLPEDIIIDSSRIMSTYQEAELLKSWIEESPAPIRSVIVVSDPFHMRRARWTFSKVLENHIEVQMSPVTFNQLPFQKEWWKDAESRKYVLEEYQKLIYYLARYQLSRGRFNEWLISLEHE